MTVAPKRRKPVQRERAFQIAVARYLDLALPASCWWTAFPAGGGGKARGGQLKAMGLKRGCGDILILVPTCPETERQRTEIIWLELKTPSGSVDPEQKEFAKRMMLMPGVHWYMARSMETIEAILQGHDLRPRVSLLRRVA